MNERKALAMRHPSPRGLYEGNLEGGLLYWRPRRICYVNLWKWSSVFIGAPFGGDMEGRSLPRAFQRRQIISLFNEIFKRNLRAM
jgi:hypothetical protein